MPDTNLEYTKSWLNEEDFPHLGFTRTWESPTDFPTYEPDEGVVRRDMQSLHDETKDYINNELIPAVVESNSTEAYRAAQETARQDAEAARTGNELDRIAAEELRVQAEKDRVDETKGVVANAGKAAQSWAVGGTGLREDEEENNAKYWSEQAEKIAGGGVISFNNRSGIVVPQKGDYTADMVGAPALGPDGKVSPTQLPAQQYGVATMLASGWSGNTYSFEATYPHASYNISIEVAPTATAEQFEAFGGAMICGSADSNIATALGDVPTMDIPIIIKVVAK